MLIIYDNGSDENPWFIHEDHWQKATCFVNHGIFSQNRDNLCNSAKSNSENTRNQIEKFHWNCWINAVLIIWHKVWYELTFHRFRRETTNISSAINALFLCLGATLVPKWRNIKALSATIIRIIMVCYPWSSKASWLSTHDVFYPWIKDILPWSWYDYWHTEPINHEWIMHGCPWPVNLGSRAMKRKK